MLSLEIVVAVDEQLLDRSSVPPRRAIGKDPEPRLAHALKLIHHAVVGHVTCQHDAVHALLVKPAQRLLELLRVAELLKIALRRVDVDVADDT